MESRRSRLTDADVTELNLFLPKPEFPRIELHVWTYEDVAFYVYVQGEQPQDALPIYRFWSPVLETHFYTMDEAEKNKLIDNYPHVWTYEGIACKLSITKYLDELGPDYVEGGYAGSNPKEMLVWSHSMFIIAARFLGYI